jgi:hypothetical protein
VPTTPERAPLAELAIDDMPAAERAAVGAPTKVAVDAEADDGEAPAAVTVAAPRTPWPSDIKAQLRSVAELLAASPVALSETQIAEHYTGRGPWKKRLPDLLATLEALARALCEGGLWRGA